MVVEIETLRDKLSTVTAERDRAVEKLAFIKACGFEILTDALGRRYLSHKDRNHAYYASIYEESPHD